MLDGYLRDPVGQGNALEQALIRRWWHERHGARGCLVWQYPLSESCAHAVLFADAPDASGEFCGPDTHERFALPGAAVFLLEAMRLLTPQLVAKAIVHRICAQGDGAHVRASCALAEVGEPAFRAAAEGLGLQVDLMSPQVPTRTYRPAPRATARAALRAAVR